MPPSRYPGVACFWLEPTGFVRLSLRRFMFGGSPEDEPDEKHKPCPAEQEWQSGYRSGCAATTDLNVEIPKVIQKKDGYRVLAAVPDEHRPPPDDPRWPTVCAACGEPFPDGATWQVNQTEVYVRCDTGERVAVRGHGDDTVAGGLYDGWWQRELGHVGPDGIALVAICPDGTAWEVDGPASGGGRWTRVGDPRNPPTLTVSPSIQTGRYHGFLQGGRFSDDLGS